MSFILFDMHRDFEKEVRKKGFVYDEKNDRFFKNGVAWFCFPLLAYFSDAYWGLTNMLYEPAEILWRIFETGSEDEEIGALSVLVALHPDKLFVKINDRKEILHKRKLKFLFEYVIPDFLPLIVDRKKIGVYKFPHKYEGDSWVKLLYEMQILTK